MYTAEAVWDWWKNVRIVTIFCSSSDFFVTSVTAAGKNNILSVFSVKCGKIGFRIKILFKNL